MTCSIPYSSSFSVTAYQFKMEKVDVLSPPNLAATSFNRSDLQLLKPLLEALPDPLSPGLPNVLKLTEGLGILL